MWKSECPHWQFPSQPLVTLRVDVALASASYPRNASLPTGSLTNATLVSGAFPQEVASALATHGVAPVTPVAYEEGMDGHLGTGEPPYPRVPSHAQVVLQTNQPHQPTSSQCQLVSNSSPSPRGALYVIMRHWSSLRYYSPLEICRKFVLSHSVLWRSITAVTHDYYKSITMSTFISTNSISITRPTSFIGLQGWFCWTYVFYCFSLVLEVSMVSLISLYQKSLLLHRTQWVPWRTCKFGQHVRWHIFSTVLTLYAPVSTRKTFTPKADKGKHKDPIKKEHECYQ